MIDVELKVFGGDLVTVFVTTTSQVAIASGRLSTLIFNGAKYDINEPYEDVVTKFKDAFALLNSH